MAFCYTLLVKPKDILGAINAQKRKAVPTDPMADITMPTGYGTRDRGDGKNIQYRLNDDRVCAYMARMIVKHNMNFEAAVAATSPKKLTDAQIAVNAFALGKSPRVKKHVLALLKAIGIDDDAFKKYVEVLWDWMLQGDRPRAIAAAKLLGSIFGISDKADESKKPQTLKIDGFDEGLKAMGVSSTNPTGFATIEEENEDE
jgi:hypothetical protein